MLFLLFVNEVDSDPVTQVDMSIRTMPSSRRDLCIDEADLYEANLLFYRVNLQICKAARAGRFVDRPDP